MNSSRVLLALGVLAFAQLPARADVTLAGTAWYNGNTGSISPNPSAVNHWVPSNQGNITGLVLSPGDRSQFGTNSGTVYLQNLILPNAAAGGGATAAFLTVIDLSTNLVVGSSLNAVGATQDTSLTTTAPFRFDSIALSSSGSYAFVFTTTTGVSGTAVSGLPAETGQRLAVGADIDSSAENSLVVATSRWGGVVNTGATGTDLMVNTGVYTPNAPSPAGQFTNYDQWYTATYTTTAQHLTTLDAATSATVIQPAAFTAAEGFRKTGGGTYVLNTNNTNTGDVIVEQGTLRIDLATNGTSAQRVGTGVIMLNNYGAQSQASNQFSGATLQIEFGGGSVTATVNNNIEGVGIVRKTNTGQAVLTGTNTFTGILRIESGTVALDSLGSDNGEMHVEITSGGASLALGQAFANNTATIASLSGVGNVRANFGAATGTKTLEVRQNINTEFSGVLEENTGSRVIALTKTGTGVLKMSGNNLYDGATNINGGTLLINGNQSTAVGAVTVNNGGTLGGLGTVGGVTSVKSGGTLAAGDSLAASTTGTLSFAAGLTLESGSIARFELSGATGNAGASSSIDPALLAGTPGNHDHIEITGSLTLGSTTSIAVSLVNYSATWGDVFNLIDWSAAGNATANGFNPATGFDFTGAQLADGWHWDTSRFLSDGVIFVAPEPSRMLLLALATVLGLVRRRRPDVAPSK